MFIVFMFLPVYEYTMVQSSNRNTDKLKCHQHKMCSWLIIKINAPRVVNKYVVRNCLQNRSRGNTIVAIRAKDTAESRPRSTRRWCTWYTKYTIILCLWVPIAHRGPFWRNPCRVDGAGMLMSNNNITRSNEDAHTYRYTECPRRRVFFII